MPTTGPSQISWLACVRLIEGRDLVLVAVHETGLLADDERHGDAGVGGCRRDVGGRVVGIVGLKSLLGRVRRDVEELEPRRLVALLIDCRVLARPGLKLGAGEDGPAVGVVDEPDPRSRAAAERRAKHVAPRLQAFDEAGETAVVALAARLERARHVAALSPAVDGHFQAPRVAAVRELDRDKGVAAAAQIGAVREHRDADHPRALRRLRRRGCD